MRILVIEDEKKVAGFIRQALGEEGHAVDVAADGDAGWDLTWSGDYDVLVLDIMLPRRDGLSVLRALRNAGRTTPVLVVSARSAIEARVQGLDAGADDYLAKPFAIEELLARVRALMRRAAGAPPGVLRVGDLTLDARTRRARRGDREIELTQKEYALLDYFMRRPGHVLSRSSIAEHVWNLDYDFGSNVIDVYVNYLRQKVDAPFPVKLIHTVRGVGYTLKG